MPHLIHSLTRILALMAVCGPVLPAAELHIGSATASITPDRPVALNGQMATRISRKVTAPVTASALALESREGEKSLAAAIMVSCDICLVRGGVLEMVRERVQQQLPDFDTSKLILNATHTHTAPVLTEGIYRLPEDGIMRPTEYAAFFADRAAEAAVSAWNSRQTGSVGWGMAHAVVAYNRRTVFADGHATMYGSTSAPDFRAVEGYEDHGVEVLFFWDDSQKLTATAINVACPSQEVESDSTVNADFWHQVRTALQAKYGKDLVVLAWTGAAGDQSPHLRFRKQAEDRMRKLRGLSRLDEISRRLVRAWEEAHAGARQERHSDAPLVHVVKNIKLPLRQITEAEITEIKGKLAVARSNPQAFRREVWFQDAVNRYEQQLTGEAEPYQMELHALRLGDIAIATNDFELYTQYGIQMKARSPALQTFVIQLAGPGTYVPTVEAALGGGYSAIVESNVVGAEGGQVLTEETIQVLNSLWPSDQ
ncbi:MAG: hypothetical protein GY903_15465 [Fuerstiella sp.]|nr:hypothetical protein [Fuerstiella sp.]MCP4855880.1 hypothetical protein [Fuerstiella sp.]